MALIDLNEVYKLYRSSLEQLVDLVRRLIGCLYQLSFCQGEISSKHDQMLSSASSRKWTAVKLVQMIDSLVTGGNLLYSLTLSNINFLEVVV